MVTASTTMTTAGILIGRTGGDPAYQPLIDGLERQGYQVTERSSSPVGAHDSTKNLATMLEGIDFVFILVRDTDDLMAVGPVRPFQRVTRDVGLLQAQLGFDRVVLLVEPGVTGLDQDLGVSVIRLPPAGPEYALNDIVQRISNPDPTAQPPPPPPPRTAAGMGRKLSSIEEAGNDTKWIPIALLGVIAVMALLGALLLGIQLVTSGDDDAAEVGTGRAQLINVTEALRTNGSAPAGVGSIAAAGPSESGADDDGLGGVAPAGPTTGGDNQLLPASCEIDLSKDSLLDSATACDGAGVLVLEGSDGPWHNEVVAVALSEGVVGELDYERGGHEPLDDEVVNLDRTEAAFGVTMIRVSFSAAGQHVHLLADPVGEGRTATLTLRLDR